MLLFYSFDNKYIVSISTSTTQIAYNLFHIAIQIHSIFKISIAYQIWYICDPNKDIKG